MATSRIHDLGAIGTLATGDILVVDDASDPTGPSKKATVAEVAALIVPDGNDGAYSAIAHSGNGAVALDFNNSDVGFVVTLTANVTDVTISNGPSAGNQKRRTVEFIASGATRTLAFGSLGVVDSGIPLSLDAGDSFMADLVVTA